MLTVIDLFAGTGSATAAFARLGHRVFRVELDDRFDPDLAADMRTVTAHMLPSPVDLLWASPPCTSYSVGSFRHHWTASTTCRTCGSAMRRAPRERWWHAYQPSCTKVSPGPLRLTPRSPTAELGRELLAATLRLVEETSPRWWIIENPRGLMRKMPELADVERRTITHCQYGDPRRMKPTDLFGVFPPGFDARACRNGAPCHVAAPRGARTGTQGLGPVEAAMLPPGLGVELVAACEAAQVA